MEPAVITAAPPAFAATRLLAVPPPRGGFASIPLLTSVGGGGGRAAVALLAAAALGGSWPLDRWMAATSSCSTSGTVVLGMSCGGCAAKVKRILESQPEVASATIDLAKATAVVRTTPEAKAATKDWHKELGEKLAKHLTNCGFQSHTLDEAEAEVEAQQS